MELLFITLGIIVYLIIGRSLMIVLINNDIVEEDSEDTTLQFGTAFFPFVLIWILIRTVSNFISNLF